MKKYLKAIISLLLILQLILAGIPVSALAEELDRITDYNANLEQDNENAYRLIHAQDAWVRFLDYAKRTQLQPINVGLIDTSFYTDHPDLNFADTVYNEDPENLKTLYVQNLADRSDEWESRMSTYGHGTHVAGILGGTFDNGIGINGMYPFADLNGIYGYGLINAENDYNSMAEWYCSALEYMLDHNVRIINISFGCPPEDIYVADSVALYVSDFLARKLEEGKDFLLVSSAGNESSDAITINPLAKISGPVGDHIIVVANMTNYKRLASDSNYGSSVSLSAPGENIRSMSPEGYIRLSGSSMSSPLVAGTAAMVWNILEPHMDELDLDMDLGTLVKYILEETAFTGVYDNVVSELYQFLYDTYEYPLLDADAAVDRAIRLVTKDDPYQYIMHYRNELAYLYPVMPEYEWWGENYVNENGWQIWKPDWSQEYLSGLLTVSVQDFDSDGQDELLAVLFNDEGNLLHEQLLMFEYTEQGMQMTAIHDIPVETNLFYDELYSGFRVSTFAYDFNGEKIIGAAYDSYREGGGSVQALYHYDGQQFVFLQGFTIAKGSDDSVWCSRTAEEPGFPLSYMAVEPWVEFACTDDDILYGDVYEYMSPEYLDYIRSIEQIYENALLEYGLRWNRFNGAVTDQQGIRAVNILNKAPIGDLFPGVYPLCDFNLYVKYWEQEGDEEYPEAILYTNDYTSLLDPFRY